MAKYGIDWSCGHHTVEQLYGHHTERDRKIDWMQSTGKCPDCYRAQKQAEKDSANQQAAAANAELPKLIGSDKQVAWAESIRRAALDNTLNKIADDAEAKLATVPADKVALYRAVLAAMRAARQKLEKETSAKWWIESRNGLDLFVRSAGERAQKEVPNVAA